MSSRKRDGEKKLRPWGIKVSRDPARRRLAWLLPVHFCIDRQFTAEKVVTKLANAFWFLEGWSMVHGHKGRKLLRTQHHQAQRFAKSASKFVQ